MERESIFNLSLGATLAGTFINVMGSVRSKIAGLACDLRAMERIPAGNPGKRPGGLKAKITSIDAESRQAKRRLNPFPLQSGIPGNTTGGALAHPLDQTKQHISPLSASLQSAVATRKNSVVVIRREARSELWGQLFDIPPLGSTAVFSVKMATDFELGRKLPLAYSEIASLMGVEVQLGLSRIADITEFIRNSAQFDMPNEGAADIIGGNRASLKLSQDQVRDMLDLIHYFANTGSAGESGIADIIRRVGALGGVAGAAHKPMVALAATMDRMKIDSSTAATSIKNMLVAMSSGTSATKKQQAVLADLGIDAEELAVRMQHDAADAILDFVKALKILQPHKQAAAVKRFFGAESLAGIASLMDKLEVLEENFATVRDTEKHAESIAQNFNKHTDTTTGVLQILKNRTTEFGVDFVNPFLSFIKTLFSGMGKGASTVVDLYGCYPAGAQLTGIAAGNVIGLSAAARELAHTCTFVKDGLIPGQGSLTRLHRIQDASALAEIELSLAARIRRAATITAATAVKLAVVDVHDLTLVMESAPLGLLADDIDLASPIRKKFFNQFTKRFKWTDNTANKVTGLQKFLIGEDKDNGHAREKTSRIVQNNNAIVAQVFGSFPPGAKTAEPPTLAGKASALQSSGERPYQSVNQTVSAPSLNVWPTVPQPINNTNFSMKMTFNVMGLDENEFRSKIEGYRGAFEQIVQRVVKEMEHNRMRLSFAG